MTQYIDKDALVAEIERRVNAYQKNFDKADIKIVKLSISGYIAGLKSLLSFLDTLEVKEVDLEKELEDWLGERVGKWTGKECERMCRHFYELGLKVAQKG